MDRFCIIFSWFFQCFKCFWHGKFFILLILFVSYSEELRKEGWESPAVSRSGVGVGVEDSGQVRLRVLGWAGLSPAGCSGWSQVPLPSSALSLCFAFLVLAQGPEPRSVPPYLYELGQVTFLLCPSFPSEKAGAELDVLSAQGLAAPVI